jgi:hypothetical protein
LSFRPFFFRNSITVAGIGGTYNSLQQKIEDVRTFAGQTATMSFWAKADSNRTINFGVIQNFGAGGSGSVFPTGGTANLTTSWQRFSATISVPSIAGKTLGAGNNLAVAIDFPLNTVCTIDVWGVQLEAGSAVTAFETATGTPASELLACQRYYWRQTASFTDTIFGGIGGITSSTNAFAAIKHPVTMRVAPTSLDFSTLKVINANDGTNHTVSAATIGFNGRDFSVASLTISGATAGVFCYCLANGSTSAFLGFGAEL